MKRWAIERGGAIFLVVLAVYLALAPATVVDGDNAEFATLGEVGGRAHPTGYPAYVLYLRSMAWLPGASPAHTTALATALLGALVVLVLHAAIRAWGASARAATIAVALYAAGPVVLRIHTEAEVFAGNALVVATILWLAARAGPVRGVWRAGLLGLVAGLGLANHVTCVLIAPVGILGAVRGVREGRALAALAALGGLALGMSAYLYLLVDTPASFGDVRTFGDIVDFFLRMEYGGPLAYVPTGIEVPAIDNLAALARTLGRGWLYAPALGGLAWLGFAIARPDDRRESRLAWALLASAIVLAGPLLVVRFNLPPRGIGLYVAQRFHLLPLLLLAPAIGGALDLAIAKLRDRVVLAIALVAFAGATAIHLPRLAVEHAAITERVGRDALRPLPPNAILVLGTAEDLMQITHYLQHAEHVRTDVTIIWWTITSRAWYRDRLAARGIAIDPAHAGLETPLAAAEALLATGRPVFVDRSRANLLAAFPSYPQGLLSRVLLPGSPVPSLGAVVEQNRTIYQGFALDDLERVAPDDDYAAIARRRYAATWFSLAEALERAGATEDAAIARAYANQLAPERD